jgi:hypothetical protein
MALISSGASLVFKGKCPSGSLYVVMINSPCDVGPLSPRHGASSGCGREHAADSHQMEKVAVNRLTERIGLPTWRFYVRLKTSKSKTLAFYEMSRRVSILDGFPIDSIHRAQVIERLETIIRDDLRKYY